jgi:spore maturation protein CgeB
MTRLKIVFIGLSITSSWGNGHATTYRGLVRELVARGHDVIFLERDMPYYANNRDLPAPPYGRTYLYGSLEELDDRFGRDVAEADAVIVGSYVPDGVQVGDWVLARARGVRAFYDIDTPITLAALARREPTYISTEQVPRYDLYLSFTTGPVLSRLRSELRAARVEALCCSADEQSYYPEPHPIQWDLGYLGTYSDDRQPVLERLLLEPARRFRTGRFIVAGPQYPSSVAFPENVARRDHVPPPEHRAFYCSQSITLNITRSAMLEAGYSPSIRLFEAGACGVPIISDRWPGLEDFFVAGRELFVAESSADVLAVLALPREELQAVGARGRARVRSQHTAAHRAEALEAHLCELLAARARTQRRPTETMARNDRGLS